MDEGKIVILPQESELLQKLFSHYLNGASLQQLADLAAQSGLRFREDSEHWNKNRIARILDDGRYGGDKNFPPIISAETRQAAAAVSYPVYPAETGLRELRGKTAENETAAAPDTMGL